MATGKFHEGALRVKTDNVDALVAAISALTRNKVLVGVPAEQADRGEGEINNAALAYIHNYGSPAQNIPAREFMRPGLLDAVPKMTPQLKRAAQKAAEGKKEETIQSLHRVGIIAANGIRAKIIEGPFAPLADRTVAARTSNRNQRRAGVRRGALEELANRDAGFSPHDQSGRRAAGIAQSNDLVRPLNDTGQLRRSINYVLRGAWF